MPAEPPMFLSCAGLRGRCAVPKRWRSQRRANFPYPGMRSRQGVWGVAESAIMPGHSHRFKQKRKQHHQCMR